MLDRTNVPHAIASYPYRPDTWPLQTGTLLGPDKLLLLFCTCKQDGHLMALLVSGRDHNFVQCEMHSLFLLQMFINTMHCCSHPCFASPQPASPLLAWLFFCSKLHGAGHGYVVPQWPTLGRLPEVGAGAGGLLRRSLGVHLCPVTSWVQLSRPRMWHVQWKVVLCERLPWDGEEYPLSCSISI